MWLIAEYAPTALFSLRPAHATTSGGKSLIVPTPFAIKMALLDACIRTRGLDVGQHLFPVLRDMAVAARPPQQIVVNNTFMKILRPVETKDRKTADAKIARQRARKQWPYQNTIAFREYVQFGGPVALAISPKEEDEDLCRVLERLLVQINYLGKRGGFLQPLGPPRQSDSLPHDFTLLNPPEGQPFLRNGLAQVLDDCGPAMTFEHADIYSGKRIRPGKERILHPVVLPYRLTRSSRGFTLYERIGG